MFDPNVAHVFLIVNQACKFQYQRKIKIPNSEEDITTGSRKLKFSLVVNPKSYSAHIKVNVTTGKGSFLY